MALNNIEEALQRERASAQAELKVVRRALSHDVKAPLKGTLSLAEWLAEDYLAELDAEGQKMLSALNTRLSRIQYNVTDLLRYMELEQAEDAQELLNLNEALSYVLALLKVPNNISITIKNTLPTVYYQLAHIETIFENLLGNAIKFMDKPQGEINISSVETGDFWQIEISDNGPGIDPQHQERIFEIFKTLAPRKKPESTGIGLALVKKIVALGGGQVWLESAVGEGSAFYFTIPKTPANEYEA